MITLSKASVQILDRLQVVSILMENPKAPVNTELAALFLGVSERKLARYRTDGTGPSYIKDSPKPGSDALNQKVFYVMSDLIKWMEANKQSSKYDGFIRHSYQSNNISFLTTSVPFVICPEMKLHLPFHLMDVNTLRTLIKNHLDSVQIVYKSLMNCLLVEWSDPETQNLVRERYLGALNQKLHELASPPKTFNDADFIE